MSSSRIDHHVYIYTIMYKINMSEFNPLAVASNFVAICCIDKWLHGYLFVKYEYS